ncbi:apoptosis regulator BAX-like isoform X4 [Clytia hemisphaerica]
MVATKKSQTTLWIYLYRCSKLGPRSLWIKQSNCVLEELTRTICDKAIRHRMTKASIDHSPIKSPKLYETPSEKTMQCVKDMIDLIVSSHPELYTEITFKLNIPVQDERTVCRTYSEFAENLFKRGVSWPLIISLLSFSGSLAAECTRNGRSILVRRICDWATLFIVMRLKDWIQDNGGWDGMYEFFYQPTLNNNSVFPSDKLQQLNEWKIAISNAVKPEKAARFALGFFIFLALLLITFFKSTSTECKSGGVRSKFSIYRDC